MLRGKFQTTRFLVLVLTLDAAEAFSTPRARVAGRESTYGAKMSGGPRGRSSVQHTREGKLSASYCNLGCCSIYIPSITRTRSPRTLQLNSNALQGLLRKCPSNRTAHMPASDNCTHKAQQQGLSYCKHQLLRHPSEAVRGIYASPC